MRITWQGIFFVISEGPNGTNKKQVVELGKMGPDSFGASRNNFVKKKTIYPQRWGTFAQFRSDETSLHIDFCHVGLADLNSSGLV